MEITIHLGAMGDYSRINIAWFDHNNVPQKTVVEVTTVMQDKPRTLEVLINDVRLAAVVPQIT